MIEQSNPLSFYDRYETDWPAPLQNWALRLRLGLGVSRRSS